MSFANIYTHRKVAETAAKGCDVCYRATSSVLVAPENKDFFYVCPGHLKDKNFCSPIIDKEAVEAKKKKELEEEVERVKKEYEEKQRKKKEKEDKDKAADKDKSSDKEKDKDDKKTDDDKKGSDAKSPEKDGAETPTPSAEEEPRVFALHKNFYGIRIEKKRQIELARRNRERLQQPNLFPSVPKALMACHEDIANTTALQSISEHQTSQIQTPDHVSHPKNGLLIYTIVKIPPSLP